MTKIQYTIRDIPPEVDRVLRVRAKMTKKSFNQVVVDELSKGVKIPKHQGRFDWLSGTMDKLEAHKFDQALQDLNRPDPDFWQ